MTYKERCQFLEELCSSVLQDAMGNAQAMPDTWDGHELRRYLADLFEQSAMTLKPGRADYRKRYRAYKNTCLELNI